MKSNKNLSTSAIVAIVIILAIALYFVLWGNASDKSTTPGSIMLLFVCVSVLRLVFIPIFEPKKKPSSSLSREEMITKLLSLKNENGGKMFTKKYLKNHFCLENIYDDYFQEKDKQ